MKIGIIGAGAIGGTIAALLSQAGHAVEITARGDQLAAIGEHGIQLSGGFGQHTARVVAVPRLTVQPEIVFVTTKAQDAASAIADNVSMLTNITVVVVQNGLDSITTARREAPRSRIVGALALYAASYLSPGKVDVTTPGQTYIGGLTDAVTSSATQEVANILGAVMPVTVRENFEGAQWTKLVINHVNALPAITGVSVQQVITDRKLRMILTESIREAVRVARARGVRFDSLQGLSDIRLRLLFGAPAIIGQIVPLQMKKAMGARPNPGSTLQSIRRGQPTEIDFLNGAIVARGADAGVPTPVSALIVELVHEVERSGTFLTPAEVTARIRTRSF